MQKLLDSNISEEFKYLRNKLLERSFNFLNPAQLRAVFEVDGPSVVLAGAGSGKTTAVINRILNIVNYGNSYINNNISEEICADSIKVLKSAYENNLSADSVRDIIRSNVADPSEILAITFTNKAANELKERLYKSIGERSKNIWACTFHSFCARVLRSYANKLGYNNNFVVYEGLGAKARQERS